jgi:hypothetical protein
MRGNAIIFGAECFDGDCVDGRPPRIIAPLQHIFDPILGMSDFLPASRWGDEYMSLSRFSQRPRIAFDRLPPVPADLGEAMLYRLQRRLMAERLIGTPAEQEIEAGIDAGVTMLPA